MPAYRDLEAGFERLSAADATRGLIDDARLATKRGRQFPTRRLLQHDDTVCDAHRFAGIGVGADVTIEVGARQRQYQRPVRECRLEALCRIVTAACVQCDHDIGRRAIP
ncbi:hypothetical protein D3C83_18910 [compost metagenome]